MERSTYTYIQMNTSTYLLQACDSIALKIRKEAKPIYSIHEDYIFDKPYNEIEIGSQFIGLNLSFLNQLAAVLEGTLRTLLCEIIQKDLGKLGELSIARQGKSDYYAIVRAYELQNNYKEEVEFKGGWDNLKRQFREVLDINLDKIIETEKTTGLNTIFTLRNIAAHGTAIVTPKVKLGDKSEGEYPFKWQSRLQSLSVHTQKEFGLELLNAFQHPSFAYYFTNLVKEFVDTFKGQKKLPVNSEALFNNLINYKFGYINNYEFPSGDEN